MTETGSGLTWGLSGKEVPQKADAFFSFFLPYSLLSSIKRLKRASLFIFFSMRSLISHYQLKSSVRTFLHYARLVGSLAYSVNFGVLYLSFIYHC